MAPCSPVPALTCLEEVPGYQEIEGEACLQDGVFVMTHHSLKQFMIKRQTLVLDAAHGTQVINLSQLS